jgi:hypothetical protein
MIIVRNGGLRVNGMVCSLEFVGLLLFCSFAVLVAKDIGSLENVF